MTQIQWQKPVCQLDYDGLYLHQTMAELDIYTKDGSYLIPGGCVDTAPPETRAGYVAKWNGDGWEYLPDHRGKTAYLTDTGEAVLIETVGNLPEGLTLEPRPGEAHEWKNGAWKENAARAAEIKAQELKQAKAAKLAEINAAAQAFVNQAAGLDKIPEFEVATWPLQAAEAKAWAADKNAETPVLDRIAEARGVDAGKLKAAALKKTQAYEDLTAAASGRRQALAEKVEKAKTAADVAEIEVVFTV